MVETILSNSGSGPLTSLSSHGVMFVAVPILAFFAIKVAQIAKASSANKKPREWVFTEERDENGLPRLAPVKVRRSYMRF